MADIIASPEGGKVPVGRKSVQTHDLDAALARAQPGDIVRLMPGTYKRKKAAQLKTSGTRDKPITIRGDGKVTFEGTPIDLHDPASNLDPECTFSALRIAADWVVLENLDFVHCWPRGIVLQGCRDIVIRDCSGTYGRHLIWAKNSEDGPNPKILTERLTIERVRWTQDPDELLWSGRIQWCQVKQDTESGECGAGSLKPDRWFLNGAMFGSRDIFGNVTIRHCRVEHAFNAIRMGANTRFTSATPSNVNVEIHDNDFAHIRDNVTEPEGYAVNVWIHHNRFRNTYATFSFDDIWGGYWYVFSNLLWTDTPLSGAADGHDWGQCFKFHNEAMPRLPIYSFHNSIHTPWPYAKEGMTRHWSDFNNAVEFMTGGNPSKTMAPYFKTPRQYFAWDPSYQFRQTLTNHKEFPGTLAAVGFRVSGLQSDCIFNAAEKGDFALVKGSPGRGAAADMPIALANGTWTTLRGGGSIGAMQGAQLFKGPGFVAYAPHQQAGEYGET